MPWAPRLTQCLFELAARLPAQFTTLFGKTLVFVCLPYNCRLTDPARNFHRNNPCQLADAERNAPGLAARVTRFGHEAKSKTSIGRPFYPYYAAPLGTLDGNIQDPIAGWPTGKRAKVRHRPCGHGYTVFDLNRRFPWAAA